MLTQGCPFAPRSVARRAAALTTVATRAVGTIATVASEAESADFAAIPGLLVRVLVLTVLVAAFALEAEL